MLDYDTKARKKVNELSDRAEKLVNKLNSNEPLNPLDLRLCFEDIREAVIDLDERLKKIETRR